MKKIIESILNKLGFGFCIHCHKLTREMENFTDSDYSGELRDFCHYDCYEKLEEKI